MRTFVSRRWLMIVMMAVLMVLSPLSNVRGAGDRTEDAKKAIETIFRNWDTAAGNKDSVGAFKNFASDYTMLFPNGKKLGLAEAKQSSQTSFESAETIEQKTTLKTIALKGDTATTEETAVGNLTIKKPNGLSSSVRISTITRSFWVLSKGQWLVKRTRVIDMSTSVDGQPIPTQIGGGASQ